MSNSFTASGSGTHVLMFPYPTSGHIIPVLDLTYQLLTRGLTITVLITPINLPLLQPLLSLHPLSLHSLLLSVPDPPSPPRQRHLANIRATAQLHDPILQWFKSHHSPPVAIISDLFLGWTQCLASQLGIPRVAFSSSGAFDICISNSLWRDQPKNCDPADDNLLVSFPKVPNSPAFYWYQLSHIYRHFEEGDPESEFYRNGFLDNMSSWGLVFNSFTELERVYIDHMRKELGHDRVWAVGPLLPPHDDLLGPTQRGGSSSVLSHEVLTWLDQWSDHSVLYICFGSRAALTSKQMEVLTAALEYSGITFILCVREGRNKHVASDYGVVPDGFEDRVKGRGFVIKGWAPQVEILRHRAVGAFLTHCGWNSVLEGLSAGVVMLTWPMDADQFSNAKLLVDELGVGVRVGEGSQKVPDSDELAQILAESVGESRLERIRAKELGAAALGSIKGGNSERDLDELVERLSETLMKRIYSLVFFFTEVM